jgi:hypothetical protein
MEVKINVEEIQPAEIAMNHIPEVVGHVICENAV